MAEKPRVSVIIVNWNGAQHLRICLPSLLSQSFTSLERKMLTTKSMGKDSPIWQPSDDAPGLMELCPSEFFLSRELSESTRKMRLELATDFLQSDNANVFEIDKQCDLATRSFRQA